MSPLPAVVAATASSARVLLLSGCAADKDEIALARLTLHSSCTSKATTMMDLSDRARAGVHDALFFSLPPEHGRSSVHSRTTFRSRSRLFGLDTLDPTSAASTHHNHRQLLGLLLEGRADAVLQQGAANSGVSRRPRTSSKPPCRQALRRIRVPTRFGRPRDHS